MRERIVKKYVIKLALVLFVLATAVAAFIISSGSDNSARAADNRNDIASFGTCE